MKKVQNHILILFIVILIMSYFGCSTSNSFKDRDQPKEPTAHIDNDTEGRKVQPNKPKEQESTQDQTIKIAHEARRPILYDQSNNKSPKTTQKVSREKCELKLKTMRKCGGRTIAGQGNGLVFYETLQLPQHQFNTESYSRINENEFVSVLNTPLSTFSIDVDAASYSNVRRMLRNNTLPYKDAVRIEEMINYFTYDYPQPKGIHPFSITTEIGACPWNKKHKLVHIGLQGMKVETKHLPKSNLVILVDVSGSMNSASKLPLLKMALTMLAKNLRANDNIAIVVYAGAAGLVLPSTPGSNKEAIIESLSKLSAGGSTAGGAGIKLAYATAKKHFIKGGNNRVILATDGDFNVGASSDAAMVRLIEEKRKSGIFLTVLGFGSGNYKDSKMEKLANKGNGNYAYIDNILEAKKVLVNEMGGTLLTIAKDVKLQVEFNPTVVKAYRLIGYENRLLNKEDFNDDTKDAGELGSGHSVTALYEIVPMAESIALPKVDALKYQQSKVTSEAKKNNELLTVKFRYKAPDSNKSVLLSKVLRNQTKISRSENLQFSAAVAGFGMLLRDSKYKAALTYKQILTMARNNKGADLHGYRAEFIKMVEQAEVIAGSKS